MRLPLREQAEQAGQRLYHFHGGLKLRHNKKISCQRAVRSTPLPPRLFIPLLQHVGEAATATVKEGQAVLKGEVIGHYEKPVAGYLHAPTSGVITAIAKHGISHPSGAEGLAVIIKPDGRDQWCGLHPVAHWETEQAHVLQEHIARAGIVGLGGAVYPTARKTAEAGAKDIHTLILNGAECEPYISCDEMLMREQPDLVVEGARVLQRVTGAQQVIIAIEDQMGEVWKLLQDAIERSGQDDIRLVKVTTIYPEGGEKQLIEVLTGVQVPEGQRPTDIGLLCQNVATAAAAADAVIRGKPLIERIVTVTGSGVKEPANLRALLGTPISNLVEQCGGYTAEASRLILGGPMMGYALPSDANPVIKAANCLLVLSDADIASNQPEMPCIRCGECARVCPASLLPQQLHWDVRNGLLDDAAAHGLKACIECGCCDFVCPSHIPLTQWFRFGKAELHHLAEERNRAEAARQRFEAREQRLESIKHKRKRRMEEKKQSLQDDTTRKDKIAAAVERVEKRASQQEGTDSENTEPESKEEKS